MTQVRATPSTSGAGDEAPAATPSSASAGASCSAPSASETTPTSIVTPTRRLSLAWLVPVAALVLAGALAWQAYSSRGSLIAITFASGAGLRPGDPVTYRSVEVGRVESVSLSPDLRHVVVHARLTRDAAALAREGTQFWIVRPELSLTRVSGLETLLGPRYIAAEPAEQPGPVRHAFTGLDTPPRLRMSPGSSGGLDLTLRSPRLGSVSEGSPVSFREMKVGVVTSVALAPDARHITIGVHIDAPYAHLVRTNTRFWNASGIGLDLGLIGGVKLKAESLESILAGGIAFATPTKAGEPVKSGHVFDMEAATPDDWQRWTPDLSPPTVGGGA
jgi:paraquat-inducible protein B